MSNPFSAHSPLPEGFSLDVYRFGQVLGTPGAFGMTYFAIQTRSGARLAIKELFPRDLVMRDGSLHVVVQAVEDEDNFRDALRMFRYEAEVLSKVHHENVVRVLDYFETNGTGYMVMDYHEGYDLSRHLAMQKPGRLNENELRKLVLPLLDGLEAVHALNYLHRDIKPTNIYLTRGHRPMLLDFGAARQMVVGRSRPVTTILTPPFAPFEQYGSTIPQGPWTDIYAMGCVLFGAMLSVEELPPSPNRYNHDTVTPLSQRLHDQEYSQIFLDAIDWSMRVTPAARPQTIADWREVLRGRRAAPPPLTEQRGGPPAVKLNQPGKTDTVVDAPAAKHRRKLVWIIVGVAAFFFLVFLALIAIVLVIMVKSMKN